MVSGTQIAEMNIRLQFDGKGLASSMASIEEESKDWAKKLGGAAKTAGKIIAAGLAGGTAGVAAITKAAVDSFANYEQLVGGVETLFKDSANVVENYANNAYKTAGLSANEYMETATSFSASLLQGLGGDTAAAAEIANKAITDMSDNANKMGTDMGRIQDAYQGFAKQNYTMLDNLKLGYGGTAGEMARLINDSGVLGDTVKVTAKTVNDVSFDKMIEAIHVVQDNLGITGTTAKEASSTIQGSVNSMRSAWQNMLTGIADPTQDSGKLVNNLTESVSTVLKNLIPVATQALGGVGKLINGLAPELTKALPILAEEIIPPLLEAAVGIISALATALPEILETLVEAIIGIIPSLVNALIAAAPAIMQAITQVGMMIIQQLPTILASIVDGIMQLVGMLTQPQYLQMLLEAGLQLLMELVEAIPQVVVAIINALPDIITNIITFLTSPATLRMIVNAAVQLFFGLVKAVPQILGALLGAFGTLVGNLWEGIKRMFGEFAGNFGSFITGIFKGAINGVLGFIENFINTPINVLNSFIDIINGAFGWIGVNIGKINKIQLPRLAEGGIVMSATTAVIGEQGREAVIPLENNTGNWAGLLASTLADEMETEGVSSQRPITVNMTVEVNNDMDVDEVGRRLMQSIRRYA